MLPGTIDLGRVRGITIGLHYSWFLIAALITFSLTEHFRATQPGWATAEVWGVAVLTATLFFVTLLAHELAHSIVAQSRGLPVRSITLFALGGVANIEKDATSARTEFLVAIVGPITSVAIGVLCLGIAWSQGWTWQEGRAGPVASVLGWLGYINILLAIFNLIPGYPLDGGRVLRAALWARYKDVERATRTAARAGQAVGAGFIALGLLQFLFMARPGGLWLAMIGWFLMIAARASYAEASLVGALGDIRVAEVMANDCVAVEPDLTVQRVVDDVLLRTGTRCVIVTHDAQVLGLVTTHEVRAIDRARWSTTPVGEVMRPLDRLQTVQPETPLSEALKTMARENVNQLPVMARGRLEGIVSRAQVLRLLQARSELKPA